ncbi:MBL fold metallo-hydrolase [Actinoallomurus purpureus]|nr:MBL fold metallo-hydrolase [Actinoallomurus purpureus]
MDARIDKVVTSGKVTVDDTEYDVESNTYIVGDDDAVIVIDPANDAEEILKKIGEREVMAVICTDGRDHHLSAVLEIAEADAEDPAPIGLHSRDRLLWRQYFRALARKDEDSEFMKDLTPDIDIEDGGVFEIADAQLEVMHTPGHTPGSICLYSEQLGVLFSGDTLHKGRPGRVGDEYHDLQDQLNSIGSLLGPLPKEMRVLPGQGEETTVGDEDSQWESWFALAQEPSSED